MIDLYQSKFEISTYSDKLAKLLSVDDRRVIQSEIENLRKQTEMENFWQDLILAKDINKKINLMQNKLDDYERLSKKLNDLHAYLELIELGESSLESEFEAEFLKFKNEISNYETSMLLKGKYDNLNAILTLHSGAGGTEADDWTSMLYDMYKKYANSMSYKVEELDYLAGGEVGIKSVTFLVKGENAYGYLKAEKGVHRLVRISPFDANARRHTSFASLEVMPDIEDDEEIVINNEDLKIDTYRSSGAGGQHVNKTESAIRITHIPSGIVVQCQNERSQIKNREMALKMLKSKLTEKKEREDLEKAQEIKGTIKKIEWGSQIRSYVFCPYTLVKDHRTGYENNDIMSVMNGEISEFIKEYLKRT